MSDMKKLLDSLTEMATVSGSVATVSAPLGATRTRAKGTPSVYGEQVSETESAEKTDECEVNPDKEQNVTNNVKTPANFGLWQNSYHQAEEQKKQSKTKKSGAKEPVSEARLPDEMSELDRPEIQSAMRRMKAKYDSDPRTNDQEKFSRDLGRRLQAAASRSEKKSRPDEQLNDNRGPGGLRPLNLAEQNLDEADLIMNPFERSKKRPRDIFSKTIKQDHEVSMARSDLLQCIKNSERVIELLSSMSDRDNIEAWVQEKIVKANDYLNTITEYLEGKTALGEGVSGTVHDINMKMMRLLDKNKQTQDPKEKQQLKSEFQKLKTERNRLLNVDPKDTTTGALDEGEDLDWDDPDLVTARKMQTAKKKKMAVVKPKDEIGFKIADIGPGGREHNVKTDAAWDRKRGVNEDQYRGQYPSKAEAVAYAKEKIKSFRDPEDGIEIWALPSGGFDVVHTMNSNGRNHVVKNGGKKLGTVGQRYKGVAEAYDDSMTDAEWERESQREKSEKEQARKEIQKNHVSQFKTKDEAVQYANDKLKTFKDSKIGMSVYSMPDGGFDVISTARTAAAQKRSKLISDAGGKHLGTLGPRYTKHKMAEAKRKLPAPKFTLYPSYHEWRQELASRGDDQIDHLDNDSVDGYRVLFAVDRNRQVVGMYYHTADIGTFVPAGKGFSNMIYYASTDPNWPYDGDDGEEDLRETAEKEYNISAWRTDQTGTPDVEEFSIGGKTQAKSLAQELKADGFAVIKIHPAGSHYKDGQLIKGVAEGEEQGTFATLKGWQQWNVLIMNNFYNGRYPDYSAKLYGVVASSPEEARQVVLDNADYVLKDLLSRKTPNGKRWLPPKSAVPIEDKRVGGLDQIKPGSLTTMGFKPILTPDGLKNIKFSDGQIVDIQGEESEVTEGGKNPSPGWMLRQDPVLAKKVKDAKAGYKDLKKYAGKDIPKKDVSEGNDRSDIRPARVGDEIVLKNSKYRGVIVKLGTDGEFSFKNESDGKRYRGNTVMIDRNLSQENRYKERSDTDNKRFDDAMARDMERIDKSGALKKFGIGEEIEGGVAEGSDKYRKLTVRDLSKWMDLAKQNGYQIQKVSDDQYQAWREHKTNDSPIVAGFWFNGNDDYPSQYWVRVPKTEMAEAFGENLPPLQSPKEDDPYEQGWRTFYRRGDESDNPYERGTPEYKQWLNGFQDGEAEPNHYDESVNVSEKGPGLWANIHAKRERIKKGSGERMRKPGSKGAPSAKDLKAAQTPKDGDKKS